LPVNPNTRVAGPLQEATTVNYEIGFKGEPSSWFTLSLYNKVADCLALHF
jgi:hypothetical protein